MQDIQHYSAWRTSISIALDEYRAALHAADVSDAATLQRMTQAAARVRDDRLSVAFVAEFSRGKSELINAICLLYTSPSPRDRQKSRMPSSA